MAPRENQGLQIALIIFVMIVVVLCVTNVLTYTKIDGLTKEKNSWKDKHETADTAIRVIQDNFNQVKEWMGHEPGATFDNIHEAYDNDMKMFAANWPEEKRNYRELPSYMIAAIRDHATQVTDLTSNVATLDAGRKQILDENQTRVTEVESAREVVATDLTKERSEFNEERGRITTQSEQVADRLKKAQDETNALKERSAKELDSLGNQVAKLTQINHAKDEKIKALSTESFESAHGRLVWVNQRNNVVYINLGRKDGLRSQMTFSVYDENASSVQSDEQKGTIEVTRILGDHQAEARIVSDQLGDPLLSHDQIYSPVWQPGRRLRFALAGLLDLDDDGDSDLAKIRNIITMNGGLVDAQVDEDGKRVGKLTINTRYLILGEQPTEKASADSIRAYTNIITDAQNLGVERLSLDRLISMMGWKAEDHTEQLGRRALPDDFRVKGEGFQRESTGDTSDVFRERRPPARAGGAYD